MRTSVVLLLVGLCALASAGPQVDQHGAKTDQYGNEYKVADKVFLGKQKDILRLFKHVFQPNYYKDQADIARSWNVEAHMEQYTHRHYVKEFLQYWEEGFLPRGEPFSVFYEHHRNQSVSLFHLFYHAKDFETFYKTACWARDYVNEGMFVYAMHAAIFHRHDTQGIILPPIYEIYPHFFVNSEVIRKAYEYKMRYGDKYHHKAGKDNVYYVHANYSGWYMKTNPEQYDLSYFTEDVGLNAYYYYYHMDYPFWLGGEEYGLHKDRRGELFYWVHQQILARYYMERLSNGYGSTNIFSWEEPIETGFVPTMTYPNGMPFPVRPAYTSVVYNPHNQAFTVTGNDNQFAIQELQDYERRIRDAIDSGYVITDDGSKIDIYTKHGFDILGKIVDANPDSPNSRFYGCVGWGLQMIARQVLGYSTHPTEAFQVHPSALEHYATALRDPVFYEFYKRIIYLFLKYKSHLPHYTYSQLNYPGFTVEGVDVDKLVTYFDHFDFEITNALYVEPQEWDQDSFQVWARQHRLTHKPFTYKIHVTSDRPTDVAVRVFIGPKYDEQGHEIPINENRVNFFELDKFVHTVQPGKNVILRQSHESDFVQDRTSYRKLYELVFSAYHGKEEFHLDMSEAHNGFPKRFMLPKGTHGGQVYQFYVYVSPYHGNQQDVYDDTISAGVSTGARYMDDLPFGFPLDRQIKDEHAFYVPNSYFEDVVIFHKTEGDFISVHQRH